LQPFAPKTIAPIASAPSKKNVTRRITLMEPSPSTGEPDDGHRECLRDDF
jgi:hypothetical protein